MNIKCLKTGVFDVNCYILSDSSEACVIDPGGNGEEILDYIKGINAKLKAIILTHGHFDHIGAAAYLKRNTASKLYIHADDEIMLTDNDKNLSFMASAPPEKTEADERLFGGETIRIGKTELKIYHTPGHSAGGICVYTGSALFSGDLLFKESIGRFDYGDLKTELKSLSFVVNNFPEETVVYPGHGDKTSIEYEKKNNYYILNHIN